MATTVTKVIDTDSGSSRDYGTMAAWESDMQADITLATGSDEIQRADCRASTGIADTTAVIVEGWTTGAGNYIEIFTGVAHRHDGKWNTDAYRIEISTSTYCLSAREDYVRVDGLQIQLTRSSGFNNAFSAAGAINASNDIRFSNCIVELVGSGSATIRGIGIEAANALVKFWNCISYATSIGTNSEGMRIRNQAGVTVANCTVFGHSTGIGAATPSNIVNCAVFNNDDDYSGSFTSITYSASDDTQTGTGNIDWDSGATDWGNNFVDYANGDVHLKSTAPDLIGAGTDDPLDPLYDDDIDGDTRTSTWDIGADEYVSGGVLSQNVEDALSLASSYSFYQAAILHPSSSVSVFDTASLYRAARQAWSDAVTLFDSSSLAVGLKLVAADLVTLLDSSSLLRAAKQTISDVITVVDSSFFMGAFRKTISDAVSVVDDIAQTLFGGTDLTQAINDLITLADSTSLVNAMRQIISDTVTIVDSAATNLVQVGVSVRLWIETQLGRGSWTETQLGRDSWTETQKPKDKWDKE